MRRNINVDELLWDTLYVLAQDMNYSSRQDIINAVLWRFVNMYPDAKMRAGQKSTVRTDMRQVKENYEVARSIPKLSEAEMRELAGDELYESLTAPMADRVEQAPELPEL